MRSPKIICLVMGIPLMLLLLGGCQYTAPVSITANITVDIGETEPADKDIGVPIYSVIEVTFTSYHHINTSFP